MSLLEVSHLHKRFPIRRGVFGKAVGHVHAVEDFSCRLERGHTLGLVGESGSGKTTAARCLLRLIAPSSGSVRFDGQELTELGSEAMRRQRRHLQMIFQDPYGSLNPRLSVQETLVEPMLVHGLATTRGEAGDRARELLQAVGLQADDLRRFPHQFSGGQRQRIGIARALAVQPRLIVCDEAVSALDVSVQAQVLNLLMDIQEQQQVAYLFIAHDLGVVAHICDAVAVMYLGEIVEEGTVADVFRHPLHPYTQALLAAVPPDAPGTARDRIRLSGDAPSPMQPSSRERFIMRFPEYRAAFEGATITMHEVPSSLADACLPHRVRCARLDVLQEAAVACN